MMNINIQQIIKIQLFILSLSILISCCKKDEPIIQTNNWQMIYQDSTVWMSHIQFIDENTGFVLALNKTVVDSLRGRQFIFKTTDAGKTWIKFPCLFPTFNDGARMIVPLNTNTLLAGGYFLYLSKDNGLNWNKINPTYKDLNIFDIYIKDSLNWILADGNDITLTTDAGNSFKKVLSTDFTVPFTHLAFPSNRVGYACGGASDDYYSGGFIAKTTDGGLTWTVLSPEPWHSTNKSFPDANAIQFITEQTGYIFTEKGEIYKTMDGGNNWKLITKMSFFLLGHFSSENAGYCVDANSIYETNNGGKTWKRAYSDPYNGYVNILDMFFFKSGEGYSITIDGKIIKTNN